MVEKEGTTNNFSFKQPLKLFFFEAVLFFSTLILGIMSVYETLRISEEARKKVGKFISFREPVSVYQFVLSFLFVLLLTLLVIKFVKSNQGQKIFLKLGFAIAISFGAWIFYTIWIGPKIAFIFVAILVIWWFRNRNVLLHNFLFISGAVGVGSFSGLGFDPLVVVLMLVMFSIYDIIAVYKTKHMVEMAKTFIEAGVIPGIVLSPKISDLKTSVKNIKVGGKFLILGGGDIVLPLFLVASVVPHSTLDALIIAIFATIGLLVSFLLFMSQETRKPIPALPPIATFSIIGYLCTFFI